MAPKKNIAKTSTLNNVPEKPARKRAWKNVEKPKLKTPTIIKLKIPLAKMSHNVVSQITTPEPTPTKKRRLSHSEAQRRKIELANEVALVQLVKPTANESPKAPPAQQPKKPKRAPRKQKAPVAPKGKSKKSKDVPETLKYVTEEPVVVQSTAKINKKSPAKLVTPKAAVKPKVTKKQMKKADSTSKKTRKQAEKAENQLQVTCISKKKTRGRSGKIIQEVTSIDIESSASILDLKQETVQKDTETTNMAMVDTVQKSPVPIDSRKTSTSECLSWTKDISSSSTTTCVTVDSNDYYRIDKKIPLIRLSHLDNNWRRQTREKNDYMSSSDSESSDDDTKYTSSPSHSSRSLDLSSESSYIHQNSFQSSATKDEICKYALEKLSSQLKKLDLEFLNWIGHESETVDSEIKMIQDKIFKILKEESEAITYCRNIKKIFKPDDNSPIRTNIEIGMTESQNELLERANKELSNTIIDKSEDDEFTSSRSRYVMFDQNCEKEEDPLQEPSVANENSEGDDNFTSDKVRYTSFEGTPYNDDDDALSLFAESLTGIESSRLNSSTSMSVVASEYEEYVPQPLSKDFSKFERPIYQPTKITTSDQNLRKIVCEKQNADSTYREADYDVPHQTEVVKENTKLSNSSTTPSAVNHIKLPSILDNKYRTPPSSRSIVFKGVCFYNLISNCMKARCLYPHKQINEIDVKNILNALSDNLFVEEYMIMRNWPVLRRKFGILYVEECQVRKLTATLIEMTIDFISKAKFDSVEDLTLKVNVLELTLLHLNTVEINDYCHLLRHNFGNDILLCDVLMHTIAETQNFSRFKLVFINLTNYIISIGRTIMVDVANQILERVCIFPPEKLLTLAVMKIIQNTDSSIFNNAMLEQFEKQLLSLDKKMFEELLMYKSRHTNLYTSPHLSQEGNQLSLPLSDRENGYTSPDTTKLDMKKTLGEPVIKRIINLPRTVFTPQVFETSQRSTSSNWRSNTFQRHKQLLRQAVPIGVPGGKRHMERHVAFGPPPKFPRNSGPDFN